MVDWDGLKYHLKEHKFKYMMITMMLIFIIIGIILVAVGSHTLDTLHLFFYFLDTYVTKIIIKKNNFFFCYFCLHVS